MPRGLDPFGDIGRWCPGYQPGVVFDLGANVGQSAAKFLAAFPSARVFCYEPATENFRRLTERFAGAGRIRCMQMALGSASGDAVLLVEGASDRNRLLGAGEGRSEDTERTAVRRLDEVCRELGIGSVDYLKVDTEGHDLEVLRGAEPLLVEQRIDFVQVEAGMNAGNRLHVPFAAFCEYLNPRGIRAVRSLRAEGRVAHRIPASEAD
jgi:FkbM family methyltransferase